MKTVLIVDDMAVFREPIAASLSLAGYQALCAADGEEALAVARANHPDVIVLDVAMPKMDAMTFLKHLRADTSIAKTSVIILTALSDKKYVLAAGSFGVRDYLLKSRFRLKDLLTRIEKAYESAQVPAGTPSGERSDSSLAKTAEQIQIRGILTHEQFLQKIQGVLSVKTLPGVVAQVISLANSAHGDIQQLAGLITRDAMLSARVLQVANSAAYGSVGTVVTNVLDAIRKIGFVAVRNIAAAIGVLDCLPDASADGFNPVRHWQHSFAVAQICERLASVTMAEEAGLAYIVGLCHDLGDIFFRSHFAREYQQVVEITDRTGQPIEKVFTAMLGMSEGQMTSSVLKCVGIPAAIREPIEQLHLSKNGKFSNPLARVLWMAENYANAALLASGTSSRVAPLTKAFCAAVAGDANPKRPDAQALRAEVLMLTLSLAKVSRSEEARLAAPMFQPSSGKIWLARERTLSQFDPVEIALASIAEVQISDRLPIASELDAIRAIIVVAPTIANSGFTQRDIEAFLSARRAAGKPLACLAVASELPADYSGDGAWSTSLRLSQLASLTKTPDQASASQKAA
ncbi:MAG TPA: HDOD domain-containing protein [Tepidisphaeraceae bacterium]|nr:HDOD domain-containing protein [Tepidisphaeraceae bacterium]